MQATTSLERSSRAQTAVVSLATFGALALLGMVLAYWTWTWFAPRSEPRATALSQSGNSMQSAYSLFGKVDHDRNGATLNANTVKLLGLVAASDARTGYAILRIDAKQTIVKREGEEIEPGVRLAEVHADHVILTRKGTAESLAWPLKNAGADSVVLPPISK